MTDALRLEGIQKRFGAVQALHDADFTLAPGEFHALLGENGAGKSTLMHIAAGLVPPDGGRMFVGGIETLPHTPREARALGIGMVHQHFSAVPAFSVAENIALAANWSPAPGFLGPALQDLMDRLRLRLAPGALAESLTVAQRQQLEILMAVAGDARVLLLDEPTAVLAPADARSVLEVIRGFTAAGGAAVLITHKLSEALHHADRVTVLRRGHVAFSGRAADQTERSLATAMLGEPPASRGTPPVTTPGETIATCSSLVVPASAGGTGLRDGTLTIRRGEIVALAAVAGNGERELMRALAGVMPPRGGGLEVRGRVAFIAEDRSTEGLIPAFSLTENLALAGGRHSGGSGFWIDWAHQDEAAAHLITEYDITASGPNATAGSLSGGNQQRFVIARALAGRPDLIVAEQPARGLDLKAADEVHARLRAAATAGAGVLVHTADLDELLTIADRIVVVAGGRTMEPPAGAGRSEIGRMMLGGQGTESAR
jgi:general nucleoside transport system ATP-binding protein